jgi:hypothetical protein
MTGAGCAQVTAEYIRDLLTENATLKRELQAFVDAQEKHFGDATTTHIRMSTLAITARLAIKKAKA